MWLIFDHFDIKFKYINSLEGQNQLGDVTYTNKLLTGGLIVLAKA